MALVAALFIGIGIVVPWYAFNRIHLLFDPIYPPVTLAVIYVIGSALSFMRAERDRREIHGAFSLYLSPDQVKAVVRQSRPAGARWRDARDHRACSATCAASRPFPSSSIPPA